MASTTKRGRHQAGRTHHYLCYLTAILCLSLLSGDANAVIPIGEEIGVKLGDVGSVESTCRLESFYVIDANVLAKRAKIPLCNADKMFRVSPHSGQIYLRDTAESQHANASAMHFFGTYAAPWFLTQGIIDSPYQTRDQNRARVFYVNDYCYYMWWLAAAQSKSADIQSPGAYLIQIYKEILKLPAWKRSKGADFVFFFPWSINHVVEFEHRKGKAGILQEYLDIVCSQMGAALQITVENLQGRNMCKRGKESSKAALVAPFVPNVVDVKGQALMESLSMMDRTVHPLTSRKTLAYFKGRCAHHTQNPGRLLRSHVASGLAGEGADFEVKCIEQEPTKRLPFEQLLSEMEQSVFCLVLPESGQSARLLSEAMLAGCIPVFIGPPFAAMPFHKDLDYTAFSLILYLTEQGYINEAGAKARGSFMEIELEQALQTSDFVAPDASLNSIAEVAKYLRRVPEATKLSGLKEVQRAKRSFMFYPELDSERPSAVDLLTLNLCRHMNRIANASPVSKGRVRRFLRGVYGVFTQQ